MSEKAVYLQIRNIRSGWARNLTVASRILDRSFWCRTKATLRFTCELKKLNMTKRSRKISCLSFRGAIDWNSDSNKLNSQINGKYVLSMRSFYHRILERKHTERPGDATGSKVSAIQSKLFSCLFNCTRSKHENVTETQYSWVLRRPVIELPLTFGSRTALLPIAICSPFPIRRWIDSIFHWGRKKARQFTPHTAKHVALYAYFPASEGGTHPGSVVCIGLPYRGYSSCPTPTRVFRISIFIEHPYLRCSCVHGMIDVAERRHTRSYAKLLVNALYTQHAKAYVPYRLPQRASNRGRPQLLIFAGMLRWIPENANHRDVFSPRWDGRTKVEA